LFLGDDGFMITDTYTESVRIYPESRFEEFKRNPPAETIARVKSSHHGNWLQAIAEGGQACSHWDYASGLTEIGLLGNVAIRANTRIEYDARKMRVTNVPEANRFLKKEYPKGWILS